MPDAITPAHKHPHPLYLISVIGFALALALAGWLRFSRLDLKPFHHDEGVNSFFLMNLARDGSQGYKYNPENYHGPTLYYFTLVSMAVFGRTDFALRFWPALFGVLAVALLWWLREKLGAVGLAAAALAMALSPGLVFFSRYFIHEMMFAACSLAIVVGAWLYAETKKFAWLAVTAAAAGLLFATKETAIITVVVFLLATFCAAVWDITRTLMSRRQFTPAALVRQLRRDTRAVLPSLDHTLSALIIFAFINVFFYTSSFTNAPGIADAFKSILHWTRERSATDHIHPFFYYLGILFKIELPLLVGAVMAGVVVIFKGTRFWLFTAAWTLGIVLAYSLIPYKTPWLVTSFLIPLALVTGYAAEQLYQLLPPLAPRLLWALIVITALIVSGQKAVAINFEQYEDNGNETGYFTAFFKPREFKPYVDGQYGYVYAQTDKKFFKLVQAIKDAAEQRPTGKQTGIHLATGEYWPLPWYLRDYDQVAYSGTLPDDAALKTLTQQIIVAKTDQREKLDGAEGWRALPETYTLRPGVELMVYVRD